MLRALSICCVAIFIFTVDVPAKVLTFYVATNGNDQWSGRLATPTRGDKDGPFATLSAALKAARAARNTTVSPVEELRILLRGGTYQITEPVVLTAEDSGTSTKQPLTIAAYRDEKPILSGGRRIVGWKRVAGKAGLWQADIPEVREGKWYFRELFVGDRRKQRARTPNQGLFMAEGDYLSEQPVKFKYRAGDIKQAWAGRDAELVALHKWIDLRQFIREVDDTNRVVTLSGSIASHVREPNARYYIENTPDALDEPGEWYLDRKSGVLVFWPETGEDLNKVEIIAPAISSGLLKLEGDFTLKKPVQHIVLRGLTFAHTDWTLPENGYLDTQAAVHVHGYVLLEGAVDCVLENCTFTHLGNYALELGKGCQQCRVISNEMFDIGAGGIRIGEAAKPQQPFDMNHGHAITDNHLHQLGRVYTPAVGVIVFQSGQNQIAHNHIHDLYYTAISVGWNWGYQETPCRDNAVEFNHLHDIGQGILSDMGGIYTLGIQKGTALRNNLIHDVNAHSYGGWGLYTDEGSSDILLENNVVYRCKSAGFHQHYGRENIVRNNIFAFGKEHQLMRSREEEHVSFIFTNNIVYFDSGTLLGSYWSNNNYKIDDNVYFDARTDAPAAAMKFADASFNEWQKRGHDVHSLIADPMFIDPKRFDFQLKHNSPALTLGFKPIDLSRVGVRGKYKKQVHDTDR